MFIIGASFVSPVFAQEGDFDIDGEITIVGETIVIDYIDSPEGTTVITGGIDTTLNDTEIEFCLVVNNTTIPEHCFTTVSWQAPSYDISLNASYTVNPPFITYNGVNYDTLVLKKVSTSNPNQTPVVVQSHNISDILGQSGEPTSDVVVDFPGWEIAKWEEIGVNGVNGVYPKLKTKGKLTPHTSSNIYLMLEDRDTNAKVVLALYKATEGEMFPITWPPCEDGKRNCDVIKDVSPLIPGHLYSVYLSDAPDGLAVDYGNSENTYITLELVPEPPHVIEFTTVEKIDDSYFKITGTFNNADNREIAFRAAKSDGTGAEIFLGAQLLEPGSFVFPDNPAEYPLEETAYTIRAYDGSSIIAEYHLASDGTGSTVTLPPDDTDPTPESVFDDSADNILKEGIVTDCGYGRMCGFTDAIRLITRVVEYIFILVIPIAAIVFAYAGFLYLTSGGDPGKRSAARRAMTNVVIGIVIVMAAWLVVRTIVISLGVDPEASWLLL
ncbi:hypothetical protein KC901_00850 [Patescibacteria group bacterium]|nr:hypothetical protein [Patescibacteria group bacterium]